MWVNETMSINKTMLNAGSRRPDSEWLALLIVHILT